MYRSSMSLHSSKSKPTTNRMYKSISQKEILFSYFLLSAVDLFQRKIVMYSFF